MYHIFFIGNVILIDKDLFCVIYGVRVCYSIQLHLLFFCLLYLFYIGVYRTNTDGYEAFYTNGWWIDYNMYTYYDWQSAIPSISNGYRLEDTIQEIADIKSLCEENNIQLVIFTNPMYDCTYRKSVEDADYLKFIEMLSTVTDFYNFSGLNDVTIDQNNYIDTSHYNAFIGDQIIEAIVNNNVNENLYEQGFGWYVSKDNVEELIEKLRKASGEFIE